MHGMEPHDEIEYWRDRATRLSTLLAERDAEVGRLQLLLACATRERDLRIERAVATAKQRDSALADVERMRAVFEAAVEWHSTAPMSEQGHRDKHAAFGRLASAIDTATKAGAR